MQERIATLYAATFGRRPEDLTRVSADGSQRVYFRVSGPPHGTLIGAYGPDPDENRAFLSFSRTFRAIGLPVPEIHAADESQGIWLEEDLGDTTLFQALAAARAREGAEFPAPALAAYQRVVRILPRFQVEGGRAIDFSVAYPRPAFDLQSMQWDLNYFKYHFLKLAHVPFNEQRLENDFQRLADHLLEADTGHFLYRDFQSRNIMVQDGAPRFIDYQGGRRGAPQYDLASLLYDAKAAIPDAARARLFACYVEALREHVGAAADRFADRYPGYALIRILQAMGAYGYRGFFERKTRFLESVPYAARNLGGLLAAGLPVELPELERALEAIVAAWAHRDAPPEPGLTVHVASFSFLQGPPADESGHGGGFVFDCRSLPNPGRLPEFASWTGRDPRVVEYLERAPEVETFWSHVRALVDAHVASYRARGFSDLTVAFGCTGGQHRSVYFAERLARHLAERHPDLHVRLEHGQRERWPEAEPAPPAAPGGPRDPAIPARGGRWTR